MEKIIEGVDLYIKDANNKPKAKIIVTTRNIISVFLLGLKKS